MNNTLGKIGLIIAVIGVILIIFGAIFGLIMPTGTLMQVGFWLGIVAIVLGVLTIIFADFGKSFGIAALVFGIFDVCLHLLLNLIV